MKPQHICADCAADSNLFDPSCANCGRRYLAAIKARPMNREDKVAWLRKVLADWMKYGHSEAELRTTVLRSGGATNTPVTSRRNH